jgi:hypothetical protein
MKPRTILHVGADKCGSSSIQEYLSNHPMLNDNDGNSIFYYAISKAGVLGPKAIANRLRHSVTGYVNSTNAVDIAGMSMETKSKMRSMLGNIREDVLLSNEGWLRMFGRPKIGNSIIATASAGGKRAISILAFVRPPVKWINSAWWQWGAWDDTKSFDQWLIGAINSCKWINPCMQLERMKEVSSFTVKPIRGDVVSQLIKYLGVDGIANNTIVANKSLPADILRLYQQFRELRPSPHRSGIDFTLIKALGTRISHFSSAPWVLSYDNISRIMRETHESNMAVLDFMDDDDKNSVLNDPSWWLADSYADRRYEDPSLNTSDCVANSYQMLSAYLLEALHESFTILAKEGLIKNLESKDYFS